MALALELTINFELFLFYYHYYALALNLYAFYRLLYKASLNTAMSASQNVDNKMYFSLALSVSYCAVPFYFGLIYNDELQLDDPKLWITPVLTNFVSIVLITLEYVFDAIQFDNTNMYKAGGIALFYCAMDCIRRFAVGDSLISIWTWTS